MQYCVLSHAATRAAGGGGSGVSDFEPVSYNYSWFHLVFALASMYVTTSFCALRSHQTSRTLLLHVDLKVEIEQYLLLLSVMSITLPISLQVMVEYDTIGVKSSGGPPPIHNGFYHPAVEIVGVLAGTLLCS